MFPLQQAALLLIDFQKGFDHPTYWGGKRNNPQAEQQAARILQAWRASGRAVFHAQHHSLNPNSLLAPGQPGHALVDALVPVGTEHCYAKTVNSAFIGTSLHHDLQEQGIQTLLVAGLTTDHCVSTSVRMAANFGYRVYLLTDACATFPKQDDRGLWLDADTLHHAQLASLNDEFATLLTTSQALEWI